MIHHLAYRRGVLALSTICNECYSFRTRACLGASAYTSSTYLQGPDDRDCGQRISQYPQSPLSSSVRLEYVRDWEDVGPLSLEDVSLENFFCAGQLRNLGGRKLSPHPTLLSGGTTLTISNQPRVYPLTLSRPPLPRPIVSSFSEPYALLHSMLLAKLQATPFDLFLTALAPAYSFNAKQVEENMSSLEEPHLDSVFAGYGCFEYVQLAHSVGSQSGNGNLRTCQRLFLFKGGAKSFREPAHAILRSVMLNRLAGLETVRMHVAQLRCRGLHVAPQFSLEGPESGATRQLERRVQNIKGAGKFRSQGQEKLKQDISILSRILKNKATWGARTVKLLKDSNLDVTPYHVCEVLRIHHSPIDRALKFFKWAKQQKKCRRGNFMYTKMIKILGDAEKFDEIWPLLEDMKKEHRLIQPSLFLGIIKSYIRVGRIEDAVVAFDAMESYGCRPNTLVFNSMLYLFIKAGEAERAEFLFRKMGRSFCAPDLYTYSLLIDSRGKAGQLDSAFDLFQEMHRRGCEPNVFTYSSLISSLGKAGRFDEACNLLQGMKINGCAPNNVTYNGLISSLGMAGQADLGHHYYEEMLSLGFIPDLYTYAVVIANLVKVEKLSEAHKLFQIATAKTRFSDFDILKSVTGSLCKSGQCEAGLRFFEAVQRVGYNPSAAACNVLIHSLSKAGHVKKALDLFEDMSRRGASSDLVACNALSNGLIKEGSLMAAIKVVRFMTKQGINPDLFTYTNLVNLLCKADRFDDAYQVRLQPYKFLLIQECGYLGRRILLETVFA